MFFTAFQMISSDFFICNNELFTQLASKNLYCNAKKVFSMKCEMYLDETFAYICLHKNNLGGYPVMIKTHMDSLLEFSVLIFSLYGHTCLLVTKIFCIQE